MLRVLRAVLGDQARPFRPLETLSLCGTMTLLSESRRDFFRYMCINCGKELIQDFRPAPGEPLRGEQADAGVHVTSSTRVVNGVEHSVTVETLSNYNVCECPSVWHEFVGRRAIYR